MATTLKKPGKILKIIVGLSLITSIGFSYHIYTLYDSINNELMFSDINNALNHIGILIHATDETEDGGAMASRGEHAFYTNPPFHYYDYAKSTQSQMIYLYWTITRGYANEDKENFTEINKELKELHDIIGNHERHRLREESNYRKAYREIVAMLEENLQEINSLQQ
ncbi:hypothetical protein Amet_1801 [Alkaliphilus metalliredigens QYMF]|uniref:Uncharacterized protein n=1 Tax=Alkaliphilus metalliredigens (strain QYMF) TaxID=293826 RepID=A6TP53_ALKMQ|nr:hypothetical protein [Alkaliphilus metalliredigens]ABR47971.1 hypothetical protein Amet_1801 [Alkaliphilus metalliredigens QYMF]